MPNMSSNNVQLQQELITLGRTAHCNGPYTKLLTQKVIAVAGTRSTAQHSTAQHSTAQRSAAQGSTAQDSTAPHRSTAQISYMADL